MFRGCLAVAMACLLTACGGPRDQGSAAKGAPEGAAPGGPSLSGAGATFPAPLYSRWAEDFLKQSGAAVNYQPIGSGGGVKQILAGTVVFGGTDKPLAQEELTRGGLSQFPTVLGGVVPVLNVPGLASGQLRLTGAMLADIFRGEIKTWRDPRLAAAAGGASLPNLPITVLHRSDASGTTFLFSSYLAAKNPAWKQLVGANDALEWPVGVGAKGNDGIAAYIRQTVGSIGYVEYSYARRTNMAHALLQNREGAFVAPTQASFAAAAAGADWTAAPGFNLLLLDEPGAEAWPITGATFVLVHKARKPADTAEAIRFFDWAFANGDAEASRLGYVPLPAPVKELVRAAWRRDLPPAKPG